VDGLAKYSSKMATSFLLKENEVTTIAPANRYVPWSTGSD
jgi:hypothetical protein